MMSSSLLVRPAYPCEQRQRSLTLLIILSLLFQSLFPLITLAPVTLPESAALESERDFASDPLPAPALSLPPELVGKPEITALRTGHSATFALGDGQFALLQESEPLHYQDRTGNWQRINPAFQRVAGRWVNNSNSVRTLLDRQSSAATINAAGISLQWQPQALEVVSAEGESTAVMHAVTQAKATLNPTSDAVRYQAGWTDSSFDLPLLRADTARALEDQWQSRPGSVEYTMRLQELPAIHWWQATPESLDLRVQITLQPGATLKVDGKPVDFSKLSPLATRHPLVFVDANGEELILHPPSLYEQHQPNNAINAEYVINGIKNQKSKIKNSFELHIRTPWSWLAAPQRHFPVIIDPLFQMRDATTIGGATYDPVDLNKPVNYFGKFGLLGRSPNGAERLLLRFLMPVMPAGTEVEKAYLLATPTGIRSAKAGVTLAALQSNVKLFAVSPNSPHWWEALNAAPSFDPQAPIAPGAQSMSFHADQTVPQRLLWDVTTQAQSWNRTTLFDPVNPGLLLQATNEQCLPELLPNVVNPICGAFEFEHRANNWSNDELASAQSLSTPNAPYIDGEGKSSGVRLLVFYRGHLLNQGEVYPPQGSMALPPDGDPYHEANHVYTIPPLADNRWQALVARSIGTPIGTEPPTQQGQVYRIPLQGSTPMRLKRSAPGQATLAERELRTVNPLIDTVGYILFNGRGAPASDFDQNNLLYIHASDTLSQAVGYDVRLISEQTQTINSPLGVLQTLNYEFDSADPLSLWNVTLPAPGQLLGTANSRVTIRIEGDGTQNQVALSAYASKFRATLINSNSQDELPTSDPVNPGGDDVVSFKVSQQRVGQFGIPSGPATLRSPIFAARSGQYALALAYDGPKITVNDFCDPAICGPAVTAAGVNGEPIPIKYRIKISVLSCPNGSFPTQGGACQEVKCPTNSTFPIDDPSKYAEAGGLGLWSVGNWLADGAGFTSPIVTSTPSAAPLLGPRGRGAPTIAVVGGRVHYDKTTDPDTVTLDAQSTVMLIRCTPNVEILNQYFTTYDGAMKLTPGGSLLGTPSLAPSNVASGLDSNYIDPFLSSDRADVSEESIAIKPDSGADHHSAANGTASLRRRTGSTPDALVDLHFALTWSLTVAGWPSLSHTVTQQPGDPAPEPIASLLINLGTNFSMDVQPVDSPPIPSNVRSFGALRAQTVTITQDMQLGGASKNAQAVILPRGVPIPADLPVECPASCIDLRALDDAVNHVRRVWEMPDVHVVAAANLVMMRSAGALQVFSSDHPALAGNGMAQDYSFDAYKASVSVQKEFCTPEEANDPNAEKVLVIRGETRMALPNLGSNSDPSAAISAGFKLCAASLRNVHMSFQSPVGIPIGNSGLFLTGLSGEVEIWPEHTRIIFGLDFQAAPGGNGGIFKAHGEVTIDTLGLFAFQGQAKVLGVVDVTGKLWVAWNPLDTGFEVHIGIGNWLDGFARAHMWQGQGFNHVYTWLPDNDEDHFAGEIGATLTLREGEIGSPLGIDLPPGDISFGIELAFGQFCVNDSCTVYEWGVKGKFVILDFDIGLYYGFDSGLDFILGNDDFVLIDQYGGAQSAPILAAGGAASAIAQVQAAPQTVDGTATIPFTVSAQAEQMLVGLGWQAGTPQLSLVNPEGVEININNAAANGAKFAAQPASFLMSVVAPKAGLWQAKVSNLSAAGVEHYKFLYFANKGAPGPAGQHGALLTPATANENGNNGYTITWQAPADTSEQAKISLFYRNSTIITGNLGIDVPIVQNLPYKNGAFQWNTTGLRNGSYQIKAVVDDGVNELPVEKISNPDNTCLPLRSGLPYARAFDHNRFPGTLVMTSTGTIQINDLTPPATPTGFTLKLVDGVLLAQWQPRPAGSDVTHYRLRWGARSQGNPAIFAVENQQWVTADTETSLRIGAVKIGVAYGVDISAIDANGNSSPASAPLFATPDGVSNPVPLTPISFTLGTVTSNSAAFSWSAGEGAVPASYRLTYVKLGTIDEAAHNDVNATTTALNNLQTGATYDVIISAANAEGWQSATSAAIRVLISNGLDGNGDGLPDDWATAHGVSNGAADSDGDGLSNSAEVQARTNPTQQDSDGDGRSDGEEQHDHSDPLNENSFGGYSQPRLRLADEQLRFQAKLQTGGEAATQSVQWLNVGGGNLQLQASSEASWLQASVVGDKVQVGVNHNALAPGFYSSVVRLSAAPGSDPFIGEQRCIRVNAWVLPADTDTNPQPQLGLRLYLPLVQR